MGDSSSIRTAWFAGEKRDSARFWGPPVEFWLMPVAPKRMDQVALRSWACIFPLAKKHSRLSQNSNSTAFLSLPSPMSPPVKRKDITGVSNPLIRFSYLPYKALHTHPSYNNSLLLRFHHRFPFCLPPPFFRTPDAVQATTPPSPRRSRREPRLPTGREPLENAQKQTERRKPFPPAFAMLKPCFRECARAETRTERRAEAPPFPHPHLLSTKETRD